VITDIPNLSLSAKSAMAKNRRRVVKELTDYYNAENIDISLRLGNLILLLLPLKVSKNRTSSSQPHDQTFEIDQNGCHIIHFYYRNNFACLANLRSCVIFTTDPNQSTNSSMKASSMTQIQTIKIHQ
jgi:hypothetical protein